MAKILFYLATVSAVMLLHVFHVDCIDSAYIVQLHNDIRHLILQGKVPGQPRGKNIVDMQWDDQLAAKAQRHAEECVFEHEFPTDNRFSVGQNLAYRRHFPPQRNEDWKEVVNSWYQEHQRYTYDKFSAYNPGKALHYLQLVWANTKYVGCGFAFCPESRFQNNFVCDYGPAGNQDNEYPYERA